MMSSKTSNDIIQLIVWSCSGAHAIAILVLYVITKTNTMSSKGIVISKIHTSVYINLKIVDYKQILHSKHTYVHPRESIWYHQKFTRFHLGDPLASDIHADRYADRHSDNLPTKSMTVLTFVFDA